MQITVPNDAVHLSLQAGYADVEQFVLGLLDKERERLAIERGIQDLQSGRAVPLETFDRQFRETHSIVSE